MWFFKKKSVFDCSLYKEPEKPKPEEKAKMPKEVIIKRATDSRLTNRQFGVNAWENEDGSLTLLPDRMQIVLLMDIRDRLDILIKKLDKVDSPPEKSYNEEAFYKAVQDVFYSRVVQS